MIIPSHHIGHHIQTRTPDMGGSPVTVCLDCNERLPDEPHGIPAVVANPIDPPKVNPDGTITKDVDSK